MDDSHDVSKYTDEQIYDILDINNPTDRELEARIVHLINKYSNMQNESGYKLAIFFQNIYSRFFDLEDTIEGFGNPLEIKNFIDQSGNQQKDIVINENKNYKTITQDIQSTTSFDYVKDNFALNPLLKQTIKRIICIDSQYRDNKNTSLSSEFTFNLSEPLRDVVSLKLESIQIPITWYTISNSYGSNFIYLKGNTDGINNGFHDYKIEIKPGNYNTTSSDSTTNLITVINNSIKDLSNIYTDTNFGNTLISYNNGNSKITMNIDIQKVYNESYFQFNFENWTPSINRDLSGNDLDIFRSISIPSYLGFNSSTYNLFSISSNQSTILTEIINDNYTSFEVDVSNNYFNIIQYQGIDEYNSSSLIINNFKINITNGLYFRNQLITEINNQIKKSNFLDSSFSLLEQVDITNQNILNNGYSYFRMSIKLNRYAVKPVPNSKVIVIFPDEVKYNRNPIWTIIEGKQSGLFFDNLQNKINTVYAELNSIQSSFPVSKSTNIYFKCINPVNYSSIDDFSMNDINVIIPPGNYILNDFIDEINKAFTKANKIKTIFNTNTKATIIDSKINFIFDIINNFSSENWTISFDETSVLNTILKIPIKTQYPLSNDILNKFDASFNYETDVTNSYIFDSGYIFSFSPKYNYGNKREKSYDIYLPYQDQYVYINSNTLLNDIIKTIKEFPISNGINIQYPLSNSYFTTPNISDDNLNISVSLIVNINYFLTENNYEVYFNDNINNDISQTTNSWNKLNINYSYNLYNEKQYQINKNYSSITSIENIKANLITITNTNNQLNIIPFIDATGGSYTNNNNMTIKIPNGQYSKYQLITIINELMNQDSRLYGCKFISYTKKNTEYIKIYMNINIIYTTKDYKLVFYDPYSFVKCFTGSKSVRNTSWDSTLGWILGFKDYTEYELKKSNVNEQSYLESPNGVYTYNEYNSNIISNQLINTSITLTGDTSCTLNIYNYFMIILDDYIQNHLNDGLVTITKKETNISLPSYSSQSIKICDPVTNTPIISTTTNNNGLTSKQIYAMNQSLISKRNAINSYSKGPNVQDIFAMIPLKISGIQNGSYYVETGGTLQNQERVYFGPVNIQRMSIKLVNDRGDIVDLNKVDWSFSFICEQLYRA